MFSEIRDGFLKTDKMVKILIKFRNLFKEIKCLVNGGTKESSRVKKNVIRLHNFGTYRSQILRYDLNNLECPQLFGIRNYDLNNLECPQLFGIRNLSRQPASSWNDFVFLYFSSLNHFTEEKQGEIQQFNRNLKAIKGGKRY